MFQFLEFQSKHVRHFPVLHSQCSRLTNKWPSYRHNASSYIVLYCCCYVVEYSCVCWWYDGDSSQRFYNGVITSWTTECREATSTNNQYAGIVAHLLLHWYFLLSTDLVYSVDKRMAAMLCMAKQQRLFVLFLWMCNNDATVTSAHSAHLRLIHSSVDRNYLSTAPLMLCIWIAEWRHRANEGNWPPVFGIHRR